MCVCVCTHVNDQILGCSLHTHTHRSSTGRVQFSAAKLFHQTFGQQSSFSSAFQSEGQSPSFHLSCNCNISSSLTFTIQVMNSLSLNVKYVYSTMQKSETALHLFHYQEQVIYFSRSGKKKIIYTKKLHRSLINQIYHIFQYLICPSFAFITASICFNFFKEICRDIFPHLQSLEVGCIFS